MLDRVEAERLDRRRPDARQRQLDGEPRRGHRRRPAWGRGARGRRRRARRAARTAPGTAAHRTSSRPSKGSGRSTSRSTGSVRSSWATSVRRSPSHSGHTDSSSRPSVGSNSQAPTGSSWSVGEVSRTRVARERRDLVDVVLEAVLGGETAQRVDRRRCPTWPSPGRTRGRAGAGRLRRRWRPQRRHRDPRDVEQAARLGRALGRLAHEAAQEPAAAAGTFHGLQCATCGFHPDRVKPRHPPCAMMGPSPRRPTPAGPAAGRRRRAAPARTAAASSRRRSSAGWRSCSPSSTGTR